MSNLDVFDLFNRDYSREQLETMSLRDWLLAARDDKMLYASPSERMISAMGEAELVDTAQDARLSRIFFNRTIKVYPAFEGFYGMEDTIERIVGYFKHAAQGLEEKRQILYLLGPVGGGKSSLAERLKDLMEKNPIYVLKAGEEISPVFESPLGLFRSEELGSLLADRYGIDRHRLTGVISPWALKRLDEFSGDISKFEVARLYPSKLRQIAISKTEPGDENNQDISALVGKVDIRKLEHFSQNDPDAYSFSGGLCHANQGLLEFVEMFKAPIKVLHPLLTATQEGNFKGTEGFGAMPYQGTVLAHSNESEWKKFSSNRDNEAFLDRICIVKVPYCLRVTEEAAIYQKLLRESTLLKAPCAPGTLAMLARYMVLSRLKAPANSSIYSKLRVYDGENLRESDPQAKTVAEYREMSGIEEGMSGFSTRYAFKLISKAFNRDPTEVSADPVTLLKVIEESILSSDFSPDVQKACTVHLKEFLIPRYLEELTKEIQAAYLESYADYGQELFDRYVAFADFWIQEEVYVDPATGVAFDKATLNAELEKLEKPAGIGNPKDFRHEIVNHVLRAQVRRQIEWWSMARRQ